MPSAGEGGGGGRGGPHPPARGAGPRAEAPGGRGTGLRAGGGGGVSCGSLVRMVAVGASTGSKGGSQRPAKANARPDAIRKYQGWRFFPAPVHSKKPLAGIRQRRRANASRNEGTLEAVSARALMSGRLGSAVARGRRPQRRSDSERPLSEAPALSTPTRCVGAVL